MTEGATGPRLRRPHTPPQSAEGGESQYGACTATAAGRTWRGRGEKTAADKRTENCFKRFFRWLCSFVPSCCLSDQEEEKKASPETTVSSEVEMGTTPEPEPDLERGDSPSSLLQEQESQAVTVVSSTPASVQRTVEPEASKEPSSPPAPPEEEQENLDWQPVSRPASPAEELSGEDSEWVEVSTYPLTPSHVAGNRAIATHSLKNAPCR